MSLAPVPKESSRFADLEAALWAAGLPTADLEADEAQYFSFSHQESEALAFVGLISFGKDGLLRSLVVPKTLRGQGYGHFAIEEVTQLARGHGIQRLWLLTTNAERYFVREGFRVVPRKDAPTAIAASRQFASTCPDTAVLMCLTLV